MFRMSRGYTPKKVTERTQIADRHAAAGAGYRGNDHRHAADGDGNDISHGRAAFIGKTDKGLIAYNRNKVYIIDWVDGDGRSDRRGGSERGGYG